MLKKQKTMFVNFALIKMLQKIEQLGKYIWKSHQNYY